MRSIYLCVLLLFATFLANSQMTLSTLKHNFGDLQSYDGRFVDVEIKNLGPKDGYILSVRKPSEVVYIQSQAIVKKDSTLVLRFQVNPRQKGKFSFEVLVYTSDKEEAHKLVLSGNMLELETNGGNSLTACPDFNALPAGRKANQFDLLVVTIDAQTRKEIENTQVGMIQDGFALWNEKTDKTGRIKKQGTSGLAYFTAKHPDYASAEKGSFINFERNKVVIEMTRTKVDPVQPPVVTPPAPEVVVEVVKKDSVVVPKPVTSAPKTIDELASDNFDANFFKAVNVVFVLDVSSSMNQGDKMELMKYSLNQLSEMIRAEDYISLVTYASQAKVLLAPTTGSDKEAVRAQTKGLKASGMTAGGDGIVLGFKQAEKGFIKNGVNHVFVITDGGFNQSTYNYKKVISKYAKKNIQLSVVGVLNDAKAEVSMREIAALGNGEYIPIFKLLDAQQNIRQMIRRLAFM